MKRNFFCKRHLALCTILWAQSLIGQTMDQYETANDLRDSSARPSEDARPNEDARPGARPGAWPSVKRGVGARRGARPGEGARLDEGTRSDTSAWLSARLIEGARPGEGARRDEYANRIQGQRPGEGQRPGVHGRVKQEELELMRVLTITNWPEWSDGQLDSAAEIWLQWWVGGAPREATALVILSPEQQFALEIYQSQFGWPRDSSEWRALSLSTDQRELLQRLYHQPRGKSFANQSPWSLGIIDPKLSLGWICSGCGTSQSLQKRLANGGTLALQSSAASWHWYPWQIRSPSDFPLRFWGSPRSVAVALQPRFNVLWPDWTRKSFDRILLARDSSGMVMVDVGLRRASWAASMAWGSRGWLELAAVWYGPGGLLLSVQRDLSGIYGTEFVKRPAAVATPWRPLRGNRATAAMPLWAGRLTINATNQNRSASWADRTRSLSWYPGQLQIGTRHELLSQNSANQKNQKNPSAASSSPSLRGIIYLGNAQGASLQFRWPLRTHSLEFGLAGITSSAEILDRTTGPMTLWRPGITQEAAWQWTNGHQRISIRIRQSPSGWSTSLRMQLDLNGGISRPP